MDGASPGSLAIEPVNWVGTTACAPQACIIEWPPFQWPPTYQPPAVQPAPAQFVPIAPGATFKLLPPARELSDADVDRIARRVVELLREAKP